MTQNKEQSQGHAPEVGPQRTLCYRQTLLLTVPAMAASESALAASFPEKVAPSMLAKYFCFVKQPARKKLEMGEVWTGRYNSRPAVASYTESGVLTTADFSSCAPEPSLLSCIVGKGE